MEPEEAVYYQINIKKIQKSAEMQFEKGKGKIPTDYQIIPKDVVAER